MEFLASRRIPVKSQLLLVSLAVLVADQWTKRLVESSLPRHVTQTVVPGILNLIYVRNTGVAFGLFPANGHAITTLILTLLGFTALGIVVVYYWRTSSENRLLLFSLSLVLGGAVGNLVDRIMSGSVIDFIDLYLGTHHWPTFNIADSAISVGIALMVLDTIRPRARASAKTSRNPEEQVQV